MSPELVSLESGVEAQPAPHIPRPEVLTTVDEAIRRVADSSVTDERFICIIGEISGCGKSYALDNLVKYYSENDSVNVVVDVIGDAILPDLAPETANPTLIVIDDGLKNEPERLQRYEDYLHRNPHAVIVTSGSKAHSLTAHFRLRMQQRSVFLEPFSEEESLDYCSQLGIPDMIAKFLHRRSGGVPKLLAYLASNGLKEYPQELSNYLTPYFEPFREWKETHYIWEMDIHELIRDLAFAKRDSNNTRRLLALQHGLEFNGRDLIALRGYEYPPMEKENGRSVRIHSSLRMLIETDDLYCGRSTKKRIARLNAAGVAVVEGYEDDFPTP